MFPSVYCLLRLILEGRSSVVYGSRFLGEHKAMYYWHQVGNKLLAVFANIIMQPHKRRA